MKNKEQKINAWSMVKSYGQNNIEKKETKNDLRIL